MPSKLAASRPSSIRPTATRSASRSRPTSSKAARCSDRSATRSASFRRGPPTNGRSGRKLYLRDRLGERYVTRFRKDANDLYGDTTIAGPRMGYWRAVRNRVVNLELIAAELTEPPSPNPPPPPAPRPSQ